MDYAGTELSATNPIVTYTIKGYFVKAGSKNDFRLLRSHANADASSLFVEKARLSLLYAIDTQKQNGSGRLSSCDFSDGQFLFNWYGEQIYAHIYNGVLFAAYQDASQGFKPQSWMLATGYDPNKASCFATTDPTYIQPNDQSTHN